jgi:hypothetical protein
MTDEKPLYENPGAKGSRLNEAEGRAGAGRREAGRGEIGRRARWALVLRKTAKRRASP